MSALRLLPAFARLLAGFCFFAAAPVAALAGEFTVNPIRLELGAQTRSGVIAVRNEGKDKLVVQMQAVDWTQDAQGADQYTPTQDLVFFPKIATIAPDEEAVIRIGTRQGAPATEKTYRLFIEELPGGDAPAGKGPRVTVLIRFGAPIFVKPAKPEDGLEVESVQLVRGEFAAVVRNIGNQHQMVQGLQLSGTDARGQEVFALTLADRYLLAGTRKRYATTLTPEQCGRLAQLTLDVKTDKLERQAKLPVTRSMCP